MSTRTLLRLSGLALLIGSLLYLIGTITSIVTGEQQNGPPSPLTTLIHLTGLILLLMGLPAFYARQAAKTGILGLIGWILFLCSGLLATGIFTAFLVFVPSFPPTTTAGPPPASLMAFFLTLTAVQLIGGILLGVGIIRAGVFAPWIGWLLIVSSVLSAVTFPLEGMLSTVLTSLSDLTLTIALGWGGYILLQSEGIPVQEAPSPTFSGAAGSQD